MFGLHQLSLSVLLDLLVFGGLLGGLWWLLRKTLCLRVSLLLAHLFPETLLTLSLWLELTLQLGAYFC